MAGLPPLAHPPYPKLLQMARRMASEMDVSGLRIHDLASVESSPTVVGWFCLRPAGILSVTAMTAGIRKVLTSLGEDSGKVHKEFFRNGGATSWPPSGRCAAGGSHGHCQLAIEGLLQALNASFERNRVQEA
jgi:hypothetical protein